MGISMKDHKLIQIDFEMVGGENVPLILDGHTTVAFNELIRSALGVPEDTPFHEMGEIMKGEDWEPDEEKMCEAVDVLLKRDPRHHEFIGIINIDTYGEIFGEAINKILALQLEAAKKLAKKLEGSPPSSPES